MKSLELYLSGDYLKEKEQQESIKELIEKVIPIYEKFYEKGWGYTHKEEPRNVSTSTTAMIAFSMSVLMGGKFDLAVDETGENIIQNFSNKKETNYQNIFNKALSLLLDTFKEECTIKKKEYTYKKKEYTFNSLTYGENDPFTLTWTKHLIENLDTPFVDKNNLTKYEEDIKKFNNECKKKVKDVFESLYVNNLNVKYTDKIDKNHIFPLLKIVQLYYAISNEDKTGIFMDKDVRERNKYIENVKKFLENSLHQHLSLASIKNSNFDTAELVFALEGMLLLDLNRDNFDKDLLERVFEVVKERQEISLYWRPLKPFVLTEQGLALLPLSAEIAMSLIRICRLLGNEGNKFFSKYYEMFAKYTDWLKARVAIVSCDYEDCESCPTKKWCSKKGANQEKKFYGWCSEHIHQPDVIHPWETSQVLVYLINFNDMLQKHIAYKSFKLANLSSKKVSRKEHEKSDESDELLKRWTATEPVNITGLQVYEEIYENYINNNNCYSMLLYGPPGTGKSDIAKKIAEDKGWPLITITPSDFIASGTDQVEAKAKNIFKVLEEQKNMVVFFDEIDRLILDRDSNQYSSQSDIFQFMTPSMLVKFNELRAKKNIIFIIATNYEERIDKAIKRKGRIDNKFLVLPFDMERREKYFSEFWCDVVKATKENVENKFGKILREDEGKKNELNVFFEKLEKMYDEYKAQLLIKTRLFVWGELEQLKSEIGKLLKEKLCEESAIEKIIGKNKYNDIKEKIEKLIKEQSAPSISLLSYEHRIGLNDNKNEYPQKSKKEFLSLVFLKAEINKEESIERDLLFDCSELTVITKFLLKEISSNFDKIKEINEHNAKSELKSILKENKEQLKEKLTEYLDNEMMPAQIISSLELIVSNEKE